MITTVNKVESIIGYKFKNTKFLWEALQGPDGIFTPGELTGSHVIKSTQTGWEQMTGGIRRLALLGDRVLSTALCEASYPKRLSTRKSL